MRPTPFALLALAALAAAPVAATAQAEPAPLLSVGVLAGGSLPVSHDSRLVYDPGYHLGALAELRLPTPWLRLRVDGAFHHLGMGTQEVTGPSGPTGGKLVADMRLASATAGVVLRLPDARGRVQPYALAGVGVSRFQTHIRPEGTNVLAESSGEAMWKPNVGAGLGLDAQYGRAVLFAEARYQRMAPSTHIAPLSVGVRMR